jgi:hypothetical protein
MAGIDEHARAVEQRDRVGRVLDQGAEPLFARHQLLLGALALDRIAQHASQEMAFDTTLHQIVLRTRPHGLERQALVIEPGDHDDRLVRRAAARPDERVDPLAVGQSQIEQHDVHPGATESGQGLVEPLDALEIERLRLYFTQQLENQPGVSRVVLDEEDRDGLHRGRGARGARGGPHVRASFTISSQKCSIDRTTLRNCSRSTGLVTYALARSR